MTVSLADEFAAAKDRFERAGRQDLCEWADRELSGFAPRGRLPAYRWVPAIALGTVSKGDERLENHRLPIAHLAGDWTHEGMRQGIACIEALAGGGTACIRQPIPADGLALFTRGLRLGGGWAVTEAWWDIRTADLHTVVLDGARVALQGALQALQPHEPQASGDTPS